MGILNGKNLGYASMAAGGAAMAASMIPEGMHTLPPGTPSAVLMVGGIGAVGLGSALAIISK